MRKLRALIGLLRSAWTEYERDGARYLAGAMVYYALVSLVPLLLLLLSVLGLLLRFSPTAAAAEQQVLSRIEASFGAELPSTIERLLSALQQESIVSTFISMVGLVLTASVLVRHLRRGFRVIWGCPPRARGRVGAVVWATLVERMVSAAMVLGGSAVLIAAVALITASQWVDRTVGDRPLVGPTAQWALPLLTSLVLTAITFAALFRFLPPVPVRWRDLWPAVLLCTLGWTIAAELLALYGKYLGGSPTASGALSGVLALVLWMNVLSQLLFFGAELCKVSAARAV